MSERTIKIRDQKPGECCRTYEFTISPDHENLLRGIKERFGDRAVLVHIPDTVFRVYAVEEVPKFGVAMQDEPARTPPAEKEK